MVPKTYTYSKSIGWTATIVLSLAEFIMIYVALTDPDRDSWMYLLLLFVPIGLLLIYVIKKLFIPSLKGVVALEINETEIVSYINNFTIYWKDVFEVSEYYAKNNSGIIISMMDGSGPFKINTKWISGSNKAIFKTMQDYFEKAKK